MRYLHFHVLQLPNSNPAMIVWQKNAYLVWSSHKIWQRRLRISVWWTQFITNIAETIAKTTALVNDAFANKLAFPPLVLFLRPSATEITSSKIEKQHILVPVAQDSVLLVSDQLEILVNLIEYS